jgi:nitrate/nitrite transporter NarK
MLSKLTQNWSKNTRILMFAYSVWFGSYLPLIILIIPEVLFGIFGIETSPALWWVLAVIVAALTPFLRVRKQRKTLPDA